MVLANPEDIEADLVRVRDLLQEVAQPIRGTGHQAGVPYGRCETVNADLHGFLNDGPGRICSPWGLPWRWVPHLPLVSAPRQLSTRRQLLIRTLATLAARVLRRILRRTLGRSAEAVMECPRLKRTARIIAWPLAKI